MAGSVERTIAALVGTLIDEAGIPATAEQRAETVGYVLATIERMPDYFRLGFRTLAQGFSLAGIARHGRRFDRLDFAQRQAQVQAWRQSRIGVRRSMIAFYDAFTTFGAYSAAYRDEAA